MLIKNHESGARLKVELIDLPFPRVRQFRVRVNGQWGAEGAGGPPSFYYGVAGEQTIVTKQVRGWLVKHWNGLPWVDPGDATRAAGT
jgi:hypothetical protein